MAASIIVFPAVEPVTLEEARAHLRLEGTAENDVLSALLVAARIHVERVTRLCLIEQTWRLYLDAWPGNGELRISVQPVRSVAAITVFDDAGEPQDLALDLVRLDAASSPPRLFLGAMPAPGLDRNGIEIDIVAGYGPSGLDVPQPLRLAIMMLATRWHEARDGAVFDVVPQTISDAFEALVAPYRKLRLT